MKKKMLFICSRIPYPPVGGDRAKNFNLLNKLKNTYDIHLVVITSEPVSIEAQSYLDSVGENKVFTKNKWDFIKSFLFGILNLPKPLQVSLYYFKDVKDYVNTQSLGCDILFSTLVRTSEYVRMLEKPKVCDMADSIGQNYARSYKHVKSKIMAAYYYVESKFLIKYEEVIAEEFDAVFLFNKQELNNFKCKNNLVWIPHGVNESLIDYTIQSTKEKAVGFIGKMDYQPNIDAVLWFVHNVIPLLPNDVKFYIIGAKPTPQILNLASESIIVTGFMDDPFLLLSGLKVAIAPMVTGGGIQNKVLEAMALGVANIVSPLAAKPMNDLHYGSDLIVADTPEQWSEEIIRIIGDEDLRVKLERNARDYIVKSYTWSASANIYINTINKFLR